MLLKVLIQYGADVNAQGYFGETACHLAIRCNNLSLVRHLLQAGADLYGRDESGKCPIHTAVHPIFGAGTKGRVLVIKW